ncbi:MAG: Ig-like domain-containing protein [Anaerolineae bacterium]|nr:Ig-like domain-containing protein [Anaerolineae bacterium]
MMRRIIFFVAALLVMALTVPQLVAQQNDGVTNPVMQVVDSEPLLGQELGLSDSISLYFDHLLDCTTIGSAFSITPSVAGNLSCDGASLTFTPDNDFERANTYRIILNDELRSVDNAALLESYVLELDTVGFVAVSETFPAESASGVLTDTPITIIFNRPVVPLLIYEERDTLPQPLTIEPEIAGTGEWLNTSIYVFTPDEALMGGTTYAVRVNAGLEAADGSVMPEDYFFIFETEPPQITEFYPREGASGLRLESTAQVIFSQPMDTASVESRFRLEAAESLEVVSGAFEWNDFNTGFRFIPDDNLAISTVYHAVLDAGMLGENGGEITQMLDWSFSTVPFPSITGTSPRDESTNVRPYGGFQIYFSSDMNVETLEGKVTISPATITEPRFRYSEYGESYEVTFLPYPNTTYTITIEGGMEDIYGNVIEEGMTFSYATGSYGSEVNLVTSGPIGFYNAQRDPTQVFVRYRNMDEFDLTLYDVPLQRFGSFVLNRQNSTYDISYDFDTFDIAVLRNWTVNGAGVPENAMRFDLLEFNSGQVANAVSCSSSLPSRLVVGDTAIVITEPDPVRARSAPTTGDIVDLLYRDYALSVLEGPVCADDGLIWYRVQLRDDRSAWVAESVGGEYLLGNANLGTTAPVEISVGEGDGLEPGIYYLRLDYQIGDRARQIGHMMVVSSANLLVKQTIDTVMVWATDVQTGVPIANAPLTIFSEGMEVIATGITDESGLLFVDVSQVVDLYSRRLVVLDDGTNYGIGWSEWTDGINPYQFGQSYDFYPTNYRIYVYSDRPVYRPGQPVYFRGIARSKDDVSYTPPDNETILVTIRDDSGDTIFSENLPLSEYGTFSGQIDLADDAGLGYYYVNASLEGRSRYDSPSGGVSFTVAEYRLPEFQVDVTAEPSEVVQGDMVRMTVDSTYFFGGSVSNATIDYTVIATNYNFRYTGDGYYDFVDYNYDGGPNAYYAGSSRGSIANGTAQTDEAGEFTIEIPAELGDVSQSQIFAIEATVRDETGQTVSGRGRVVVHQGEIYIGARATRYVSREGEESSVEIRAVDWDSEPVANQNIEVEVVRREWSSVQEQDPSSGRTIWTYEVEEIPIADGEVRTNDDGLAIFDFVPDSGGSYKVIITSRDEHGNEVRSSTFVWISSRRYVAWRQQNSNRIDLISDATDYSVGDTAQILITSPFQGTAEALITVERGDVLHMERVTMDSNSFVYDLPITDDFIPNVYVSVLIIKGVDENNPVAAFRMGYVQLGVDTERRVMNIDITSDIDRASPQETVTYSIRTTDWEGNPVQAELGIGVTDLAALSLADSNSRPLLPYFYGQQSLGVRTSTPLTENTDQLTQETLDTVKGGGGGFAINGIVEIRGEFIDTPYWNPTVQTDSNGEASFDVCLPDNLTTWRLDARGVTLAADGVMLVGQEIFDLLSTKPVLIRPVTPRFFIVGDEVILSAVVNNNSLEEQEVVVSINAEGVTLLDERSQVVTIAADSRARITWRVTVDDVEQVRLSFIADAGNYTDGSISPVSQDDEGTLPVYRYEVPETVGTAGVLDTIGSRVETIMLPRRFEVTNGTLTVQVDQSLAATTVDSILALEDSRRDYYWSIERYSSSILSNVQLLRAAQVTGFNAPAFERQHSFYAQTGLQTLYAYQQTDGGWSWSRRLDRPSSPLTTAYALIALAEARSAGFDVPRRVIGNGQRYLIQQMQVGSINQPPWQANRNVWMLYALALSGAPDVARTASHYDHRDNLNLYSQALLAETLWLIDPTDTSRTDVLLTNILSRAATSAAGIHWDDNRDSYNWGSDTRSNAIILHMLTRLRPESDLLPNIVRYLIVQREARFWSTYQETTWVVWAMTDYMLATNELNPDYNYDVSFNGNTRLDGQATPLTARNQATLFIDISEMLRGEANNLVFTRTGTNEGNLYYTAYLEAYLPVPEVEALENGFYVERRFIVPGDEDRTPIDEARVGDIIEARVTIIVPNSVRFVSVVSPNLAGAEAIDPNLNTSAQVGTRPSLSNTSRRYGWGWWYFSDIEFRDEAVYLTADFLPAGTYEFVYSLRVGIEGAYNVIPVTAQESYFPDVYGRSDGQSFTVLAAEDNR